MSLNFPHKPDVQLENSPLVEVICQVRFPIILRIAKEEPAEFQELIRDKFPSLELEQGFLIQLPGLGSQSGPRAEAQSRTFRFRTADEQTVVSLAPDFYALSTNRYIDWESFAQHLQLVSDAVQRVYKPSYAIRIGLRYINRLTPANTGCRTIEEIFDLLRPELTSQSRSEAWGQAIEMQGRLVLADNGARLTLGTRYGEEQGEPFFLLDLDYFEQGQLEIDSVIERCSRYNQVIYRGFRWCVRDEKLETFKPRTKERSK